MISYSGTVAQIMAKGSFEIKCMIRSGDTRSEVIQMLGGGVLWLPWDLTSDTISFHMSGTTVSVKM